jgi:hypothetical protein
MTLRVEVVPLSRILEHPRRSLLAGDYIDESEWEAMRRELKRARDRLAQHRHKAVLLARRVRSVENTLRRRKA